MFANFRFQTLSHKKEEQNIATLTSTSSSQTITSSPESSEEVRDR